jgi:purine-binding chemotaxis protein CheW
MKFLRFILESESYGIDINCVKELIGLMEFTHVPKMPPYTKGIMNLRGKIVTLIDLRVRFEMEEKPYHERTSVIVVDVDQSGENPTGLIVDEVKEVIEFNEDEVTKNHNFDKMLQQRFIVGLGKKDDNVTLLLDVDKVVDKREVEAV